MYSAIVYANTEYGRISCHLKEIMKSRSITFYRLSQDTNIKYETIRKYYDDEVLRYDTDILAKLCFCLDCEIGSLLKYEK